MVVAAAAVLGAFAQTPTFTGEVYTFWYDAADDCGLDKVEESRKDSPIWRSKYVEVNGVKEPALVGSEAYAFPVAITPGDTFAAEVVHGTSTAAHIKSVYVMTDAQMLDKFKYSEEWRAGKNRSMDQLWSSGSVATRAWIVVEQNNVTTGTRYPIDLSKLHIVNLQWNNGFYNSADGNGGLSSKWTVASYANALGVSLRGIRYVTVSVNYTVRITGGAVFPGRVWNICDPYVSDGDRLEDIEDAGGLEEAVDAPGLFLVLPGSVPSGVSFGDTYTFEDVAATGWSERELEKSNLMEIGTGTACSSVYPDLVLNQYALFEVRGAASKSDVRPVVENLGFKGTLEVSVWSDEELRNKAMPPLSTKNDWEADGRWIDFREPGDISGPMVEDGAWKGEWVSGYVLEYEHGNIEYEWPTDVWPDGNADGSRFWIVVKCIPSEKNRWYGIDGGIRVWQQGTDVKSPVVYMSYSTDDTWPFSTDASGLFRGFKITTKFTALCPELWNSHQASYDAPLHSYWLETSWSQSGGPLSIYLPEAGILYLADIWYEDLDDIHINGVDSRNDVEIKDSDAESMYFEQVGLPWPYSRPRVISARVNSARTITLTRDDDDDDYDFYRLQFFPSSTKAVAVEASFYSIFDRNIYNRRSDNVGAYLQGYVTGTGVYKVGETVALTAIPAPGEAFDHWELKYGNFPAGIDTSKETLSFTVTDACAGTAEERRQMVVRAVWKAKRQIVATTENISSGVVFGGGFYHDGASVTLTAQPAAGLEFLGWSDGVTTATRTVVVSGDAEYVARFGERTVSYRITFNANGGGGAMETQSVEIGKVAKLIRCTYTAPTGKKFAGWRRKDTGRRYDDGMLVFNLAEPGETVTLTAIWQ